MDEQKPKEQSPITAPSGFAQATVTGIMLALGFTVATLIARLILR